MSICLVRFNRIRLEANFCDSLSLYRRQDVVWPRVLARRQLKYIVTKKNSRAQIRTSNQSDNNIKQSYKETYKAYISIMHTEIHFENHNCVQEQYITLYCNKLKQTLYYF